MINRTYQIRIGILAKDLGWPLLLDQIGTDWSVIDPADKPALDRCTVIIVNRPLLQNEDTLVTEYILTGGAAIYTTAEENRVCGRADAHRYVSSVAPRYYKGYRFSEILDLFDQAYLFNDGEVLTFEASGNGIISYFGIDIGRFYSDRRTQRKGFSQDGRYIPHERVAKRSRSSLRQLIQSHIEFLQHQRNLPFVHKWFFPKDEKSIFTFRIDSDKGTQSQIEEIYTLSDLYQIPTTWFLDVKSHEHWLEYFTKFISQEIGVHCYEHSVYNSTVLNMENFSKALHLLRRHGMAPKGIAAPTGAWNEAIGTAIREIGFVYSSEFSYDYDNLPSYPPVGGSFSPVVQLPVHPMCIGTLRRERMSEEEMTEYFIRVIDQKIALREPVCLYHHPGHAANGVFEKVFQYIQQHGIRAYSYTQYAEWWNRRHTGIFSAVYDGHTLDFEHPLLSGDSYVRISLPDNTEAILPPESRLPLNGPRWVPASVHSVAGEDILRIRKTSLRHIIQNVLDWWIKTTE